MSRILGAIQNDRQLVPGTFGYIEIRGEQGAVAHGHHVALHRLDAVLIFSCNQQHRERNQYCNKVNVYYFFHVLPLGQSNWCHVFAATPPTGSAQLRSHEIHPAQ